MNSLRRTFLILIVILVGFATINISAFAQKDSQRKQEKQERKEQKRQDRVQERDQRKDEKRKREIVPENNRGRQESANRSQQERNKDRDRNVNRDRGQVHRPAPRVSPKHDRERWKNRHQRYQRPPMGHYSPRRSQGYRYHRYPNRYRRPVVIIVARIPIDIYRIPVYRGCRLGKRLVLNFSGERAQVLINGLPYWFATKGRDFLYPGESALVEVPLGSHYDLDAAIFIDRDWYEAELRSGYGSDLVITLDD